MSTQEIAFQADRRSNRYPFPSLKNLREYFRSWLADDVIDTCILEASRNFRNRSGISEEETALQLVKKCEEALFRKLTGEPRMGKPPDMGSANYP